MPWIDKDRDYDARPFNSHLDYSRFERAGVDGSHLDYLALWRGDGE